MPLRDQLEATQDRRERAALKSRALAATGNPAPFQRNLVRWTVHEIEESHGRLRIVATARRGTDVLYDREEFIFINPPVMVPDGADADGVTTYREDPAEAVKLMLAGTVAR